MDKEKLNYYTQYYFANDIPVPFKTKFNNYVLYIKPVTVQLYPFYHDNVGILRINKNQISDARIIQMSYLQYLIEQVLTNDSSYQQMLITILNISFTEEFTFSVGYDDKNKVYLAFNKGEQTITRISAKEFDKISEIILFYNNRDYDDRYISEDLRKVMNDYYDLKFKNQNIPTLEEKKAFVTYKTGLSMSNLNQMSYRNFELIYNIAVNNDVFFSQRILQASEKYKVEDLVYPLFKKKETPFSFLQDAKQFEDKVSKAAQG